MSSRTKFYIVNVVKPQLLKTSSGIHYMVAKPSENVHLECTKQRGYPAPSYTWHQAPSSICQGRIDDCKPLAHQWKHSSLVNEIMTLPPMSNIMLYKCIASNAAGHDTKLFAVVRMGKCYFHQYTRHSSIYPSTHLTIHLRLLDRVELSFVHLPIHPSNHSFTASR